MVFRNIQTFEVIVIGLNLRPVHDIKAHRLENVYHIVYHKIKRMKAAGVYLFCGHGDIYCLGFELKLGSFCFQSLFFLGYKGFKLLLCFINKLTHSRTLFRRERTHLLENSGKLALFSEILNP